MPQNAAPEPARGAYADGFAPVARAFAAQLRDGREIGAALTVYHRGVCVVDLHGGLADVARGTPWQRDTRVVVFSVTKGLAAMAFALLADRGLIDWDAPVAAYWPGFARAGKESITVRTLLEHRAGLVGLDAALELDHCVLEEHRSLIVRALEEQRPLWEPGTRQAYHAITFGMYARELFERVTGERIGRFLKRELFAPLDADVDLGTPADVAPRMARLYPPRLASRTLKMLASAVLAPVFGLPETTEARVLRAMFQRDSLQRRSFLIPRNAAAEAYDSPRVWGAELAWASATASAHGLARAYLPFALGGAFGERRYLRTATLEPMYGRGSWSDCDDVLQKPLGWSRGFLKDMVFSPNPESFGHAGMGGALGFCDPIAELSIGYVMNRMDWRVRSPRALDLCRALYACEPIAK